jgi:uncharacterized protein (DUF924 family)
MGNITIEIITMHIYKEIYEYWMNNYKKWFNPTVEFDNILKKKYTIWLVNHQKITYDKNNPKEILGKVILLDQIGRNINRNSYRAFVNDEYILNYVLSRLYMTRVYDGYDLFLFLMPLQHSESKVIHKMNINIWETIISMELDNKNEYLYKRALKSVLKHYDVIKRFGRYPKRNKFLGRVNTKKEEKYLLNNRNFY